ncbi:MAG TPA: glycosyltransferase family 39 protein, partial [Planctomycetota bacterium]|nr:glycosyltransferase family 39 protein [Planctomycetota bacterium]
MPELAAPAPRDPAARRLLALAVALAAVLLLLGLGQPLWGSEGRWLVVARGMARSGDAFRMELGGQPYLDKPFGSYWLVVATAWLTGGFREAAGRLPCILALLATLLVTFQLGRRTVGERAGAVAALLLALSPRVLFWSHLASADPQNLLGSTLALLLVLRASEGGGDRTLVLLGAVAGATTLMKGLPGIALPAFVALLWAAVTRRAGWLRPRGLVLGALACLALAGTPFVVARLQQGHWDALQLLVRESVVRAVEPFDHVQPWWFYLVNQFELLAPWSLLLPAALLHALATLRGPGGARDTWARLGTSTEQRRAAYSLFCYAAVLVFYSLSGSRRSYYLLPIAPFAALLAAQLLLATPARVAAGLRRAGLVGLGLVGLLAGLAALGLGLLRLGTDAAPAALVARAPEAAQAFAALPPWLATLGLAIVPAAWLLRRAPGPVRLLPVLAVLAQTALLQRGVVETVQASFDPLPAFCDAVHAIVPPGAELDLRDADNAKLLFYLDAPPSRCGADWRIVPRRLVPRI